MARVLVKELIAEPGVELLSRRFDVEDGTPWPDIEPAERLGGTEATVAPSTNLTADRAERLKMIGRTGGGVLVDARRRVPNSRLKLR